MKKKYANTKTGYESEATHLLRSLDEQKNRIASSARDAEEAKYKKVFELRDSLQDEKEKSRIWSGF